MIEINEEVHAGCEERNSKAYRDWRDKVYRRDYWTCQICSYKGHDIVAHHIKPWSDYPKLRYNVDNGLTLCRRCHAKLHKVGLPTRFQPGHKPARTRDDIDDEEIKHLYWEENWSLDMIARKFGTDRSVIANRMKRADIPRRALAQARRTHLKRNGIKHAPEIDIEEVSRLYWEEDWSLEQIAKKFSTYRSTIADKMEKAGIPRRHFSSPRDIPIEEISHLYWKEDWSLGQIAKKFSVAESTIYLKMKKAGIPRRNNAGTQQRNPTQEQKDYLKSIDHA